MEKKKPNIWQIITLILLVICLFQTFALRSQVQDFSNNMSSKISDLYYTVNNISGEITRTLEQEASQISFLEYSLAAVDMDSKMVELACEVLPKEYSEGSTELSLVYDGKEYPMTFEGGSYKGNVSISVFEDAHIESVIMRDGDVTRTEALNWYISPRYTYLPMVYANMGSAITESIDDGKRVVDISGSVDLSMDQNGEQIHPKEAYFYVCLDDKEIERTELTKEFEKEFAYSFEKEYAIPFDSTLTFYIEVIDEYGLHHRSTLERIIVNESGARLEDESEIYWRGSAANIYDAEGDLLYSEYEPMD